VDWRSGGQLDRVALGRRFDRLYAVQDPAPQDGREHDDVPPRYTAPRCNAVQALRAARPGQSRWRLASARRYAPRLALVSVVAGQDPGARSAGRRVTPRSGVTRLSRGRVDGGLGPWDNPSDAV
jgi:hypothetical protein